MRDDLVRLGSDLSRVLHRDMTGVSHMPTTTVGELLALNSRARAEFMSMEKGTWRGIASDPAAYRRSLTYSGDYSTRSFDPEKPAGIRNLPPREDLVLVPAPAGLGESNFVTYQGDVLGILKMPNSRGVTIQGLTNELNAPLIAKKLKLEGIIPDVVEWNYLSEWGSLQEFIPNRGYVFEHSMFTGFEGKKIAAFDYIVAAQDRNLGNALRRIEPPDGIAAIDNEQIMHHPNVFGVDKISSEFVYRNRNQELGAVADILTDTDPADFETFLRNLGYPEEDSLNSALRLAEIQERGMIIGDAPGPPIVKPPTQSEIDALVRAVKGLE